MSSPISLQEIARALVAPGKGILAADESVRTATKRLEAVGMESTEETRRQYRDVFLLAPGIGEYLSGVLFFDETWRQNAANGTSFVKVVEQAGILPGIKVDKSTVPLANFPGEEITGGLEGLAERFKEYAASGAKFSKWRAVLRIGKGMPSKACQAANAHAMARYAAESQAAGLVPIVEPEVLLEGKHSLARAEWVTTKTLKMVFATLEMYRVDLAGLILKTSMVLAGNQHKQQSTSEEVAEATVRTLKVTVPPEVPGVVFLSGGQSSKAAAANLQAIEKYKHEVPWQMSFSFARALQGSALEIWGGKPEKMEEAQREFLRQLKLVAAARDGKYEAA